MVSVSISKGRRQEGTKTTSGNTGIPGAVQAKFEAASGLSFEDVRVHYNSSRPAQLGAYAYTQGSQVYIGPGQERYLEHELGHVVQQKCGLVKADGYINGVPINRDPGLERAADLGANQPVQGFWMGMPGYVVQMAPPGEEEEEEEEERAEAAAGHGYSVDPVMFPGDEAAGVLRDEEYIRNETAHNINDYIKEGSNYLGSKNMNGQYMYVIDMDGNIIIGTRGGQRMPHPTLVGGRDPRVQAAGIIDIRRGKIYSINNASGHFKPGNECLRTARDVFGELPQNIFSNRFQGYIPYGE